MGFHIWLPKSLEKRILASIEVDIDHCYIYLWGFVVSWMGGVLHSIFHISDVHDPGWEGTLIKTNKVIEIFTVLGAKCSLCDVNALLDWNFFNVQST